MIKVENSAQGNCMYEAYSISLMYFLRSKNNPQITETVLNKFGLTEAEKNKLISLITKNRGQEFSRESIRDIIEPVLATKARALGAHQTREDFINRPRTTGLYASAQYGLEYYFKLSLRAHPESGFLASDFTDRDYTEAEIFKVANIKTTMMQFALEKGAEVHARFESEWDKIKGTTEPKDVAFRKGRIIDDIIAEKTIEFFTEKNYRNLDAYINRLATNYVWGTEETLLTLNRAAQGEHFVRNEIGEVDVRHDTVINLQIRVDGAKPAYEQTEKPDLILNNSSNVHWNSMIPRRVFDPDQAHLLQQQEQINSDEQVARELQAEYDAEKRRILADLELARQAGLSRIEEERQIAADLQVAGQIKADDLAVAEMIQQVVEQDRQYAEQIQAEELKNKEQLALVTQQDAELAQRISKEEQQHTEQMDLVPQVDAELAQQVSVEEQQHNQAMDLVSQVDAKLAQQVSEEEQLHNEQMGLVTQQDADLAQSITAGEEAQVESDDQVVLMDATLTDNSRLHDEPLVNPTVSSTTADGEFSNQQSSVASIVLQSIKTLADPMDLDEEQKIALAGSTARNVRSLAVQMATDSKYLAANDKFDVLIKELDKKVLNLNERAINAVRAGDNNTAESLRKAHGVAETLLYDLVTAKSAYEVNPNKEAFKTFKTQCDVSIEKSRPELEHHRGLKQLLGNILLAVLGFGVLYLAAAAINKAVTGNFLFFKTESAKIVDDIKSNVNEFDPTQSKP